MLQGDSQLRAVAACDESHAAYDRRISTEARGVPQDPTGYPQREESLEPVRRVDQQETWDGSWGPLHPRQFQP